MTDIYSREEVENKLVELLHNVVYTQAVGSNSDKIDAGNALVAFVKDIQTELIALKKRTTWTNAKVRLPRPKERIIGLLHTGKIVDYYGSGITHWMPRPEDPPQQSSKGE